VNNSPLIAAETLQVEKHMWACVPPVDRMGWELMFEPPEVDSMGWESIFAPPALDSMGWESIFAPPALDSMGWEDMLTGLPEVHGTGFELISGRGTELHE